MPLKQYDRFFGGNAAKALAALKKQYGPQKGRSIFYATINKKRRR